MGPVDTDHVLRLDVMALLLYARAVGVNERYSAEVACQQASALAPTILNSDLKNRLTADAQVLCGVVVAASGNNNAGRIIFEAALVLCPNHR